MRCVTATQANTALSPCAPRMAALASGTSETNSGMLTSPSARPGRSPNQLDTSVFDGSAPNMTRLGPMISK